jgi:hypothetical protein
MAPAADVENREPGARQIPICPKCRQEGREHATRPEPGRHFICVACGARWTGQAPES